MAGGTDVKMNIHEHGTWVEGRTRVQCNSCGKRMTNFYRLKLHLAYVGKDVTYCPRVSLTTRMAFYTMLMELRSRKSGASKNVNAAKPSPGRPRKRVSPENENAAVEADKQSQRCLARFLYEHGVDFSALDSTSFQELMTTVTGGKLALKIPDSRDLNGWMLQEALKEVQDRVKEIKDSWEITGCSILLDAWIDQKGRDLVSFVADCPAGAVYLKSSDVSGIKTDVTALKSLVNGIVEEAGVHNVIQIVACSTSGWVGELGKLLAGHDMKVFWSVSISHCIELMLVEIGKMHSFGDILNKVNIIQESIHNNPSLLKIFRAHSHGVDVTALASEFEFVTPYLTVENMFRAKMAGMFASSYWKEEEANIVAVLSLVSDSSFWESVERVVRCTSALVHGLLRLSTANNMHVGYVYDILNSIKLSTALNFKNEKQIYQPIWDVVDDVWKHHLYNPLHGAGYFLNPTAYYSGNFHLSQEVYTGLTFSMVHMVKEARLQVTIAAQIGMYRLGKSCFNEASQADQISGIFPVDWWTQNGGQHAELKSFAVKILSQTCEGAWKYKLKRGLAEKLLLTEGMSHCEKKHVEEMAFVHYNLHLQSHSK
ncbi:hypothetical protein CARUB_v10015366mg [Capsella rubella]|uniref:DUF659 domain-containing protein n=1 Tax=Capsella rubella TaxID=81985 RepID=R0G9B2_9BRAS|nr:uncharacterized protein LOC17893351 [Capsella rubella]EOA32116.1 hypothetical protein CARUB_v10015366mg [Capsella rubella]